MVKQPPIDDFILKSKHIDSKTKTTIQLKHDGDFVVLGIPSSKKDINHIVIDWRIEQWEYLDIFGVKSETEHLVEEGEKHIYATGSVTEWEWEVEESGKDWLGRSVDMNITLTLKEVWLTEEAAKKTKKKSMRTEEPSGEEEVDVDEDGDGDDGGMMETLKLVLAFVFVIVIVIILWKTGLLGAMFRGGKKVVEKVVEKKPKQKKPKQKKPKSKLDLSLEEDAARRKLEKAGWLAPDDKGAK